MRHSETVLDGCICHSNLYTYHKATEIRLSTGSKITSSACHIVNSATHNLYLLPIKGLMRYKEMYATMHPCKRCYPNQ